MKKFLLLIASLWLFGFTISSQPLPRPKLVIGIVVDQMKYDYIYRYWDKLGNGGFKRLLKEGYACNNTRFNYSPTITGPGHASVYTGATPSIHGIIANDWYDRNTGMNAYCVSDPEVKCIGCSDTTGLMSPRNLLSNTIGDELKLATNFKSKVIGIALKDRGAILPAGHAADAAYWFDVITGNWITSSYYRTDLPSWVMGFNERKYAAEYKKQTWNTLLPIASYTESTPDQTAYEKPFKGETNPVFPHNFLNLYPNSYESVRRSPFGNTLTKDFAKAAIAGEGLGADNITDMLCVSFSSTDFIGHQFGTNAIETEDCYLRLDKDIEDLLNFIDQTLGKSNVLLFLTADHGALQNPNFLKDQKFNAGFYNENELVTGVRGLLQRNYGDSMLLLTLNEQSFYFNQDKIRQKGLNSERIYQDISAYLLALPFIANVFTPAELQKSSFTDLSARRIQAAFN
jgi:predicted AlkP superfamily pyrophosphatase or phosphodiesterase